MRQDVEKKTNTDNHKLPENKADPLLETIIEMLQDNRERLNKFEQQTFDRLTQIETQLKDDRERSKKFEQQTSEKLTQIETQLNERLSQIEKRVNESSETTLSWPRNLRKRPAPAIPSPTPHPATKNSEY